MSTTAGATVVVGVDGSAGSLAAVRAAAHEAVERGRPLRIVHAFIWPSLGVAVGPANGGPSDMGMRSTAERILAEAVTEAEKTAPGVRVTAAPVDGAPAPVLLGAPRRRASGDRRPGTGRIRSQTAQLVVTGARGRGSFTGLLLGSVSHAVMHHAGCPVAVVRAA